MGMNHRKGRMPRTYVVKNAQGTTVAIIHKRRWEWQLAGKTGGQHTAFPSRTHSRGTYSKVFKTVKDLRDWVRKEAPKYFRDNV